MSWIRRKSGSLPAEPQAAASSPPLTTERGAVDELLGNGTRDCVALFGTSWFQPGARMAARVALLAERHALPAIAIDVDEWPDLATRYRVTAVPSLLMLRGGEVVGRRLGEIKEQALEAWIVGTREGLTSSF
jgi:thioredoxin-like negative regulator of GroEL